MNFFIDGILFVISFLVTAATTYLGIPILKKAGIQAVPNERSSHLNPTPTGGGIMILFGIFVGLVAARWLDVNIFPMPIIIGASFVAIVGFIDDVTGKVPILFRLLAHLSAAGFVIFNGFHLAKLPLPPPCDFVLGPYSIILSFIWVIFLTNIYNFLDGIDGFAAFQGVIGGLALMFVFPNFAPILIAGASAGFLLFNWHPAKVFMGNVGSTSLGFLFAVLPLAVGSEVQKNAVFVTLVALWFFIADGAFTLIRRLIRKQKIWKAHREHLYQFLVISGLRHDQVVLSVGTAALFLGGLGTASVWLKGLSQWAVLSIAVLCFLVYYLWVRKRVLRADFHLK